MSPSVQKLVIGLTIAILLALSFVFREKISGFFSLGSSGSDVVLQSSSVLPPVATNPGVPSNLNKQEPILPAVKSKENRVNSLPPAVSSPYVGRDPEEVKPIPEEVKLFTEDQKNKIYASIKADGQAVKKEPRFFNGWTHLGLLKKTIGDFEGARDAWEYASLVEPLNSLSFSNLGELYWRYLNDYPKSEANFKISIQHKPNDIQNYISLAELYHYSYKEKYDLAPAVLLSGLKANPDQGTLLRRLAYLYEERREFAPALDWWGKIFAANPEDQEVLNKINQLKAKVEGGGLR